MLEEPFFVFRLDFDILKHIYYIQACDKLVDKLLHNQVFPNEFFFFHCPAQQEYLAPARFAREDIFLLPDVLSSWNTSIPVLDQI